MHWNLKLADSRIEVQIRLNHDAQESWWKRLCKRISNLLHELEGPSSKGPFCRILHDAQYFQLYLSTEQNELMEVNLYLIGGGHAYSLRHLRCWWTFFVENKQQDPCIVNQRRWVISNAKHVEIHLSSPAIHEGISMVGESGSENLARLLRSVLSQVTSSLLKSQNSFSSDNSFNTFSFLLLMLSIEVSTADLPTYIKKFCSESSKQLRFSFDYGMSNKFMNKTFTLWLMSGLLMIAKK